jgi:hypothetical protein
MSNEKETIKALKKRIEALKKHSESNWKLYLKMKEKFQNAEKCLIASNTMLGEVNQKYNHLKNQNKDE